MADGGEADDKIIAVMKDDAAYGDIKDIGDCPVTCSIDCSIIFSRISKRRAKQHKVEITACTGGRRPQKYSRQPCRLSASFPELESLWPKQLG